MVTLFRVGALCAALLASATAHAYTSGHVFITNRGGNNVIELDDSFDYQRTWFDGELFEGVALDTPNGMAFTPEGELYIADTFNDRIIALDATGTFVRAFDVLDRMGANVESIYFDGAGVLYASSNPGLGRVARYTRTGGDLADVVNDDSFLNLGNVNLTNDSNVIVSDFSMMNRGIRELDPTSGAILRAFGTDLGRQEDVMVDGADRIFVAHFDGDEIVVFGPPPAREELYRFTAPAEAGVVMTRPTGIVLTRDCHILVGSYANHAIFIFRHEGGTTPPTYLRVLRAGEEIPAAANLSRPECLAVAGLGLPGGFAEFVDQVPTCDPVVSVDAGVPPRVDAGPSPVDSGPGEPVDAGTPREPGETMDGCSCRTVGSTSLPSVLLGLGVVLSLRRRRSR